MTGPLAGIVVVVTRPAAQAAGFAALATAAGAQALLLPTLEIQTIALDAASRGRLVPDDYDWTIYTSANAVESSLQQLPRPQRTRVAAVGRATARALQQHGIAVSAVPRTSADSEGLLELECFADLRGRRVLILKGSGGRPLLREELARRGAEVVPGDVYQRRRTDASPQALEELRRACDAGRAVIAATSFGGRGGAGGATITVAAPLTLAHAAGAQVSGSGITLNAALARAHASGAQVAASVPTPGAPNRYYSARR